MSPTTATSAPSSRGRRLRAGFLGSVGYAQAARLQKELREALKRGEVEEHFLLLEHPHVFTLGRNADDQDVLASRSWLEERGVEVVETDRGGQVTYHGPGQLVGYPLLDLNPDRRDIRRYVRDLQEVLVRVLAELGVTARPGASQPEIGVWVGPAKIASVGVHLSRWHTTHGFALNLGTDLSFFSGIVPCGLSGVPMTSVERLTGERPDLEAVAELCARHLAALFNRRLAPLDPYALGLEG